jgi:type IV pilus assembly protein PilO
MNLRPDFKKLTKIPRKYKIIAVIGINALIFAALFTFFLYPHVEEKRKLEADYRLASQEHNRLLAIKNNIDKTRREYAALQESLEKAFSQMPEQKDLPNLLRQVSTIGQETKLRIKSFTPREPVAKDFYLEVPFDLKYAGPYHNVGYFFDGIRRLDRIIHVTSFTLEGKTGGPKLGLEGTVTAKTYMYSKEAAKETPKETKEKKETKNEPVVKK